MNMEMMWKTRDKGENKMKQKYIIPEFEITEFTSEDIITTSGLKAALEDEEQEDYAVFDKTYFND